MLFDLRSRRRRNVVKLVYGGLALLIGLGLIGFGIGTGGNFGGLFNAATSGGGGSGTGNVRYERALTQAQRQANAHPGSAAAWARVGSAAYNVAELPTNYESGVGFTKTGFATLATLKRAWQRYLALAPAHPDNTLAVDVSIVFAQAPTGIQDWPTAESAQEIVTQNAPSTYNYQYLAYLAYQAKEISRGDLAAAQAVALAPKSQRAKVRAALASFRTAAVGATGSSGSTGG